MFNIAFDGAALLVIVLLSAFVYTYIEKPFIKLGKKTSAKT